MKNKKVLVVLGGVSGERKVSLESGKACIKALKKIGYKVSKFDPKKGSYNLLSKKRINIIFNALHGKGGEDGIAQSYFEYLKIPYTHSGIISSYNAMNKIISKEIFKKNKIRSPKYFFNKKSIVINNFFLVLQISTPKLDPSLIGFNTDGSFTPLMFIALIIFFLSYSFFFIQINLGVIILFFLNISFEIILFIELKDEITPECV